MPNIISLKDVSLVRDSRVILSDLSLDVAKGDFVAITGPNGGGKTSLLRIILGLLKPSSGSVWVDPAVRIGYLPQKNMIDSHFPISVREVVASGLLSENPPREEVQRRVHSVLEEVDMTSYADSPIGALSGGQLQRALIGRAIISKPGLLVLDEPLSYIDKRFEAHLYQLISELMSDTTMLLVSHEMTKISSMANRHLIVDRALHECSAAHHYIESECE